jgi:3',5'-cyclic AMP phosphodiesterase CpdA
MGHYATRLVLGLSIAACSSAKTDDKPVLTPLPPVSSADTTDVAVRVATHARQASTAGPNPSLTENLGMYEQNGFGDTGAGPGQTYMTFVFDGSPTPKPGPNAKRLVRFVHMPDLQLMDDESPTRLGDFDAAELTSSALRPQDEYECRIINAAVRTVNALHRKDPIAFVLLGGDNADSAQSNEVDWALDILGGAPQVKCDSGNPDDPVPGPDNDGKDPFMAEGLAMPFKWVTGNHDVLVQGNLPTADHAMQALGSVSGGGTRDYSNGQDGVLNKGDFVVPDPKRALLSRTDLMAKVQAHQDGHGVGDEQVKSGKAIYTFDVDGTPLRFLILDTPAETGGDGGIIHQADIDASIKPKLDQAKAAGKYVILASHHAVSSLTKDGGTFGTAQADAVLPADWTKFLSAYPNIVFSMVAHSHKHQVQPIPTTADMKQGFWEVMTSAIADYPHEFRVVEIFDQDDGYLMLRGTVADYSTENDPVAAEGLRRGVTDFTSGWVTDQGPGQPKDRNVELWIKKP